MYNDLRLSENTTTTTITTTTTTTTTKKNYSEITSSKFNTKPKA
jgi:hypothetical protein